MLFYSVYFNFVVKRIAYVFTFLQNIICKMCFIIHEKKNSETANLLINTHMKLLH